MVTHTLTKDNWMAYVAESNYGGGDGGALHAHTVATQGNLLAMDRVKSINVVPAKPVKEDQYDIDAGMDISDVLSIYTGPGTITLECYLQTDDWYDIAISAVSNHGTEPTSLVIHFDNGVTEKDLFGCVITSWKPSAKTNNPTMQTIELKYSFVSDGSTLTKVAWASSAPSVPSNVSATIDGIAHTALAIYEMSMELTIEYPPDEENYILGVDYLYEMPVLNYNVEFTIKYKDRSTSTWGAFDGAKAAQDELNAASFFDADLVWHTTLTSDLGNVMLKEANSGVREENGFVKHEATFKKGEGFTIA